MREKDGLLNRAALKFMSKYVVTRRNKIIFVEASQFFLVSQARRRRETSQQQQNVNAASRHVTSCSLRDSVSRVIATSSSKTQEAKKHNNFCGAFETLSDQNVQVWKVSLKRTPRKQPLHVAKSVAKYVGGLHGNKIHSLTHTHTLIQQAQC